MALGIENIASYIPEKRISNYDRKALFDIDDDFIENRIGVKFVAVKDDTEETSDLCFKAFENLKLKTALDIEQIDALVVVSQNPDSNIPHVSGVLHGRLDLPETCASFDISLGCSGYVYGLSIIQSFMKENGLKRGLLFTADPYSKVVSPDDKNTSLLFGDAASVTLVSDTPLYRTGKFSFGTIGKQSQELRCENGKLFMNGRAIFNFAAKGVPKDIIKIIAENGLEIADIDKFVFHQGSKYIIDTIGARLKVSPDKIAYDIYDYGNTISSSIPIILEKEMEVPTNNKMVISGFGVGLSWASTVLMK